MARQEVRHEFLDGNAAAGELSKVFAVEDDCSGTVRRMWHYEMHGESTLIYDAQLASTYSFVL